MLNDGKDIVRVVYLTMNLDTALIGNDIFQNDKAQQL
jgi:hypothetical protein